MNKLRFTIIEKSHLREKEVFLDFILNGDRTESLEWSKFSKIDYFIE